MVGPLANRQHAAHCLPANHRHREQHKRAAVQMTPIAFSTAAAAEHEKEDRGRRSTERDGGGAASRASQQGETAGLGPLRTTKARGSCAAAIDGQCLHGLSCDVPWSGVTMHAASDGTV